MARVFVTGSADGLGLLAARLLLDEGHEVVLHARSEARAADVRTAEPRGTVLAGDLAVQAQVRDPGAPDDLSQGALTQAWLAVADDPEATVSGRFFYHRRERTPLPAAGRARLQDALLDYCAGLTGTPLPD